MGRTPVAALLGVCLASACTRDAPPAPPSVVEASEAVDSAGEPRVRFLLQVSDDERARETGDDVAAACGVATGYAHAASCAGMRDSCPSGQSVQIRNPWTVDDRAVSVPCEVLVSLTCTQGDGDLDACALEDLRQGCEQTLASSNGDDPGFLFILCALSAGILPGLACVALFPWAAGIPCIGAGAGLDATISSLGCTML